MSRKTEIIIVDDHLTFRSGLVSILTTENIATVIGEASNGEEFIKLLAFLHPDLVLMDIDMPRMNGIDATKIALELMPDLKIIVFSMYEEGEYYKKMFDQGVKGFILKSGGIDEIEKAIDEVMSGKRYLSNSFQFENKMSSNPEIGISPIYKTLN